MKLRWLVCGLLIGCVSGAPELDDGIFLCNSNADCADTYHCKPSTTGGGSGTCIANSIGDDEGCHSDNDCNSVPNSRCDTGRGNCFNPCASNPCGSSACNPTLDGDRYVCSCTNDNSCSTAPNTKCVSGQCRNPCNATSCSGGISCSPDTTSANRFHCGCSNNDECSVAPKLECSGGTCVDPCVTADCGQKICVADATQAGRYRCEDCNNSSAACRSGTVCAASDAGAWGCLQECNASALYDSCTGSGGATICAPLMGLTAPVKACANCDVSCTGANCYPNLGNVGPRFGCNDDCRSHGCGPTDVCVDDTHGAYCAHAPVGGSCGGDILVQVNGYNASGGGGAVVQACAHCDNCSGSNICRATSTSDFAHAVACTDPSLGSCTTDPTCTTPPFNSCFPPATAGTCADPCRSRVCGDGVCKPMATSPWFQCGDCRDSTNFPCPGGTVCVFNYPNSAPTCQFNNNNNACPSDQATVRVRAGMTTGTATVTACVKCPPGCGARGCTADPLFDGGYLAEQKFICNP